MMTYLFQNLWKNNCMKKELNTREVVDNSEDDVPYRYRHIHHSIRGVRPEIYTTLTKLQSKYHMSKCQAEGAIITVVNKLFG